jgi:uncharacterized YccA/Bax inhibitor family protein
VKTIFDRNVAMALSLAGVLLAVAVAMRLFEHHGWFAGRDAALRMDGVIVGAVLVMLSNAIPKRAGSASALAMRRVAGWAFVLGGFGYAFAWLVLPLRFASPVAIVVVLASLAVAALSFIRWYRSADRCVS